jgi:hypothetical protein
MPIGCRRARGFDVHQNQHEFNSQLFSKISARHMRLLASHFSTTFIELRTAAFGHSRNSAQVFVRLEPVALWKRPGDRMSFICVSLNRRLASQQRTIFHSAAA